MTKLSFDQLAKEIQAHFANNTSAEGLSLTSQYVTEYPHQLPLINYWRICFAAKMNEPATAYKFLETTLESGSWYSELILRQSPSLEIFKGEEEFERLLGISLQMQAADPTFSTPMIIMRAEGACGPESDECPTVIFLHSNQDTAHSNIPHWQSLADQGWLVALPQSSVALWADAYVWIDFESGAKEVEEHYARLVTEYSVATEKVLLSGFSMGAEVALAMALSGRIDVRGFILIGPGGPFMDDLTLWEPFIEQAKDKGLRGVILMGLADVTIPRDNIRALVKTLNENGIACELKPYPDLEHVYPDDFANFLQEAVKYIQG